MSAIAVALAAAAASSAPSTPPICADRPGKANAVCTVPAGVWQFEFGLADWARSDDDSTRTDVLLLGSSFLKLGLTDSSDLELGFTPIAKVATKAAGSHQTASGFGDVILRYKRQLTKANAPVQFALIPFVKLPTAGHDIGNGKVEGGLAGPVSVTFSPTLSLALSPEIDLVADDDGHGRHASVVNLVGLSATIAPGLSVTGELWSDSNFDPAGTVKQASADAAVAYDVTNDVQLDAGANLGLTKDTPNVELYAGVSFRF
jgi:Putative MetA-pathway of phenol degradation